MAVVELRSKAEIAAFYRRNPLAHAYELGDLDDFDWPFTRWFGWEAAGDLCQLVLLYSEPEVPVLLAIAEEPLGPMDDLLGALLPILPPELYVHMTTPLLETMSARFTIHDPIPHLKLGLRRTDLIEQLAEEVELLSRDDLAEVEAFYQLAYPGTWFAPRMLDTGRYVGVRREGRLACVAGVHVHSPPWRVAALGNVATLPELRGHGLAQATCAALCALLLADGIDTIALNVRADNASALAAYGRLGFEPVTSYVEATLTAA
jgi:ribosomal protein S18 acetylase RimI-like enzyme